MHETITRQRIRLSCGARAGPAGRCGAVPRAAAPGDGLLLGWHPSDWVAARVSRNCPAAIPPRRTRDLFRVDGSQEARKPPGSARAQEYCLSLRVPCSLGSLWVWKAPSPQAGKRRLALCAESCYTQPVGQKPGALWLLSVQDVFSIRSGSGSRASQQHRQSHSRPPGILPLAGFPFDAESWSHREHLTESASLKLTGSLTSSACWTSTPRAAVESRYRV